MGITWSEVNSVPTRIPIKILKDFRSAAFSWPKWLLTSGLMTISNIYFFFVSKNKQWHYKTNSYWNFRSEKQLTSPIVMCQHVVQLIRRTSAQHLMFRSKSASHIISVPRAYSSVPNKRGATLIFFWVNFPINMSLLIYCTKCVQCAWIIEKLKLTMLLNMRKKSHQLF